MTQRQDIRCIAFDVDGTLYEKIHIYTPGQPTLGQVHQFFHYTTFKKARDRDGIADQEALLEEVVSEYRRNMAAGTITEAVEAIPQELKTHYASLIAKHGSNGKTFMNEFGTDSGFMSRMVSNTDFEKILSRDNVLIDTMEYLKDRYQLTIMTTEIFRTVERATQALGLNLDDFKIPDYQSRPELKSKDNHYPILCAENISDKKPGREGFDKIAAVTGLRPDQVVYIGDVINKDVIPPLSLGMQAVHIVPSEVNPAIMTKSTPTGVHGCEEDKSYRQISSMKYLRDIF